MSSDSSATARSHGMQVAGAALGGFVLGWAFRGCLPSLALPKLQLWSQDRKNTLFGSKCFSDREILQQLQSISHQQQLSSHQWDVLTSSGPDFMLLAASLANGASLQVLFWSYCVRGDPATSL